MADLQNLHPANGGMLKKISEQENNKKITLTLFSKEGCPPFKGGRGRFIF